MDWLKKNYKTVVGTLIILILIEATVAWYLIGQFHEHYLSGDDALTAALSAAGMERGDVGTPDIKLRTRKSEAWYEVEFATLDAPETTYRFLIDAETGEVLADR